METLSYGYEKPQNIDKGDVVYPAMERNIQRLNDHTHNGSNSAPLVSTPQTIDDDWDEVMGGLYRQLVSIPAPFEYDTCLIHFKLDSGEFVYPSIEMVSSSSYYIYTNDTSLTYVAYYR